MTKIETLSSSDSNTIDTRHIQLLLNKDESETANYIKFKGRPVTNIRANSEYVLKLRTEYVLPELQARRFIQNAISKEQAYNIYHPKKTWFLLFENQELTSQSDDAKTVAIGSITPMMLALNHTEKFFQRFKKKDFLNFIAEIIELYFDLLIDHKIGLDLCLSNFGIDENNKLYYLDDEVYGPDNFATLCDFLALLIRSESWLNKTLTKELAKNLRKNIQNHYDDPHYIVIIAEQFKHLFIPETLSELRQVFLHSLQSKRKFLYSAPQQATTIALIADIHANAPALETVLDFLENKSIDNILILGDIVGYGPHPDRCIDIIRKLDNASVIKGNHDHYVATEQKLLGITSMAGWALNWTLDNISEKSKKWLMALPPFLQSDIWLAVHGSPIDKTFFNAYVYHMTYQENLIELQNRGIRLCFHGHTHIQKIYHQTGGDTGEFSDQLFNLEQVNHALICPGSVGQPRGGIPGAECAILNLQNLDIELFRLNYNQELVINDMRKNAFPPALTERLLNGI